MDLTPHEVLGVDPDADDDTIRAAYRRRVRETHPDAGGDAAEFVAVAAAWTALSGTTRGTRGDADPGGPDEAEEGWGAEVGLGDRAPRPPTAPAPGPPRAVPGERVDAWTADAGALPSMAEELTWLPPPDRDPSPVVWFVSLMAGLVVLYVVTLTIHAAAGGRGAGVPPLAAALVLVLAAHHRRETAMAPRASGVAAAAGLWACVGSFPLVLSFAMVDLDTGRAAPVPVLATVLGMAGFLVVALLAERRVHRARRWRPAVAAMHERRALAEAWDDLLAARAQSGDDARVEQRVLTGHWDPTPAWALVEVGSGELLAIAPPRAPEAWAATMRLAGVDVEPVLPRPASRGAGPRQEPGEDDLS